MTVFVKIYNKQGELVSTPTVVTRYGQEVVARLRPSEGPDIFKMVLNVEKESGMANIFGEVCWSKDENSNLSHATFELDCAKKSSFNTIQKFSQEWSYTTEGVDFRIALQVVDGNVIDKK